MTRTHACWLLLLATQTVACEALEARLFTRNSPAVDEAIAALRTSDAGIANRALTDYLQTGRCRDGELGTPPAVREHAEASLDLGLTLFTIAERFGQKFGTPPSPPAGAPPPGGGGLVAPPAATGPSPEDGRLLALRSAQVDCALRLVRVIAADAKVAPELRAEAYYLSGNLEFLRHEYESAVDSYDQALSWQPGGLELPASDLGTRAAWNRAIALRRIEEEEKNKPPPSDAGSPPPKDGGEDGEPSDDPDQQKPDDDSKEPDEPKDDSDDNSKDDKSQEPPKQEEKPEGEQGEKPGSQDKEQPKEPPASPTPAASGEPPPSLSQDQHILDELERAPMLQNPGQARRGRAVTGMEDK